MAVCRAIYRFGVLIVRPKSPIEGCKNTASKDFRLGLKPILQILSFLLSAGLIELLGASAYLPLNQMRHERPLLLSACFDIQVLLQSVSYLPFP